MCRASRNRVFLGWAAKAMTGKEEQRIPRDDFAHQWPHGRLSGQNSKGEYGMAGSPKPWSTNIPWKKSPLGRLAKLFVAFRLATQTARSRADLQRRLNRLSLAFETCWNTCHGIGKSRIRQPLSVYWETKRNGPVSFLICQHFRRENRQTHCLKRTKIFFQVNDLKIAVIGLTQTILRKWVILNS